MKKILSAFAILMVCSLSYAQKRPPHPPTPPHERGDAPPRPEAPPPPPSPKELFQKLKKGKKQADAKREQDMEEIRREKRK